MDNAVPGAADGRQSTAKQRSGSVALHSATLPTFPSDRTTGRDCDIPTAAQVVSVIGAARSLTDRDNAASDLQLHCFTHIHIACLKGISRRGPAVGRRRSCRRQRITALLSARRHCPPGRIGWILPNLIWDQGGWQSLAA
eukprot:6210233-Pleurochrysis_carterae.AAC.3